MRRIPRNVRKIRGLFRCSRRAEHASVTARVSPMSAVTLGPFHASGSSGRYYPIAKLGRGGMSEVYLAVARGPAGFNKLVVIKQLPLTSSAEPNFLEMFLDEARLAARLNHPNIVQTNEVGSRERDVLHRDGVPRRPAASKIVAAVRCRGALPRARRSRHRGRRLRRASLRARARRLRRHAARHRAPRRQPAQHLRHLRRASEDRRLRHREGRDRTTSETATGDLKGKIAYMAPEHIGGAPLDRRADIFALGSCCTRR